MATIRTQLVDGQRRVITKVVNGVRRVSCSCCPSDVECCMYPAEELGGSISFADLPDLLVTQFVGEQFEKRGSPLTYTVGNESFTAYYGGEGFAIGIRASDPTNWTLQVDFGFGTNQGCLISQLIQDGPPDWVYDDFADTYTVTFPRLAGYGSGTATVTRQSLCGWSGLDETGCEVILIYETTPFPPLPNSRFKWVVETPYIPFDAQGGCETVFSIKTPNQNTPAGEYSGSFVGVVTVSE
jgi:hypothetical protein